MLNGYMKANKEKGSKTYLYEIVSYEEYNELQRQIETVLDASLEQLKKNLAKKAKPKSPVQPTRKSGPTEKQIVS
jgi:predicted transcriptional regulator